MSSKSYGKTAKTEIRVYRVEEDFYNHDTSDFVMFAIQFSVTCATLVGISFVIQDHGADVNQYKYDYIYSYKINSIRIVLTVFLLLGLIAFVITKMITRRCEVKNIESGEKTVKSPKFNLGPGLHLAWILRNLRSDSDRPNCRTPVSGQLLGLDHWTGGWNLVRCDLCMDAGLLFENCCCLAFFRTCPGCLVNLGDRLL